MDYDREALLDILQNRCDLSDLDELAFRLKLSNKVSGKALQEKAVSLLDLIEKHDLIKDLLAALQNKRPDIDLSDDVASAARSALPPQPPESPQRIPFTNRDDEIKLVLSSFAPAYYLLDAPAGYGKTELLKELERRFQELERGWRCAYVSIEEHSTLTNLVTALTNKLDVTPVQDPELPWGWRVGGALAQQWEKDPKEGLVLLIDLEKRPALSIVEELLGEFIPAVQNSLRKLEFFAKHQNRFRVILAGRYLAASEEVRTASLRFKSLLLDPFGYSVIQDSVGKYLTGHSQDSINQLAAHLVYLTGGHPGCVAQILETYKKTGLAPDDFIKFLGKRILKKIVRVAIDDIRSRTREDFVGLDKVIDKLCIFRYPDYAILGHMSEECKIPGVSSGYDLANKLTTTYLFTRKGRFLRDDITRRLLAIRLWHEMPGEFSARCKQAQDMCANRMRDPKIHSPEIWVIEYLFQALQQHATLIQDKDQRRATREKFLNKDVPKALQMLVEDRNIPPEDRLQEQYALNEAMAEDWEFRFVVNYYLRDNQYNNEPCDELQRQIVNFFA